MLPCRRCRHVPPIATIAFAFATLALATTACALPSRPDPTALGWSLPAVVNDDGRGVVQFDPAITVDASGALHAAWLDFRDGAGVFGLYYSRRAAGAAGWTANQRVSDLVGPVCRDDADIAVDRGGGAHVVWSDYREVDPDVYISTLPAGGTAWSPPRRVNDDGTQTIQWSPAIAADGAGGVYVVWSDYRDGQSDIYAARRGPDGAWQPSRRVNRDPAGVQERPAIAAAPSGEVFVAWADQRDDAGDIYVARLAPGAADWGAPVRLNTDAGTARQADPALGIDRTGAVTAAWHDERDGVGAVWAARLAPPAGGGYDDAWSAGARVSAPGAPEADRPAVAGGPAGSALVVWHAASPGGSTLWGAAWRAPGWGPPARIDESPVAAASRNAAAAIDAAGQAHVLWFGDDRDRQKEVFHAVGDVARLDLPAVEAVGRLEHRVADPAAGDACPGDGFVVAGCDGSTSAPLTGADPVDLDAWLGRPVRVTGRRLVAGDGCPRLIDVAVAAAAPTDCFGPAGMAAGRLDAPPLAAPIGATVSLDGRTAAVGADGRYFFRGVAAGARRLAATARCGLAASTAITVPAGGALTRVPDASLRLGDVVTDCAIDARDLAAVTARYGAAPPLDLPCADVNGDGAVDLFDVVAVAVNQGATCPAPWRRAGWVGTPGSAALEGGGTASDAAPAPAATRAPAEAADAPDPIVRLVDAPARGPIAADGATVVDVPLTVRGARGVYGFAVSVRFDAASTAIADADPAAAGVQAAALDDLPPGAWVIANTVDPVAGQAHVAATLLAPHPPLAGDARLASLRFRRLTATGRRPRVTFMQLSDAHGRPVDFRLDVGGLVVATAYHLWLPWARP